MRDMLTGTAWRLRQSGRLATIAQRQFGLLGHPRCGCAGDTFHALRPGRQPARLGSCERLFRFMWSASGLSHATPPGWRPYL